VKATDFASDGSPLDTARHHEDRGDRPWRISPSIGPDGKFILHAETDTAHRWFDRNTMDESALKAKSIKVDYRHIEAMVEFIRQDGAHGRVRDDLLKSVARLSRWPAQRAQPRIEP
jgi:hypothetical protein